MRFSVLIPVYNVEKYLKECLDSVLQQDFTDFEVILVNDGSTDGSKAICEEYSRNDSRILFFDKNKEGISLTRRYLIKHAKGEYIVFLDSDDYMENNLLLVLNKAIEEKNPDIVLYRYRRISDTGKNLGDDTGVMPNNSFFDQDNKNTFLLYLVSSSRLNPFWTKCIRTSIVDKDEDYNDYSEIVTGEDLLQSIVPIFNAKTILYIDEVLVNYRKSNTGIGRNFKEKYIDDFEIVRNYVLSKLKEHNVSEDVFYAFYTGYLENMMSFIIYLAKLSSSTSEFELKCKKIQSFSIFQDASRIVSLSDLHSYGVQKDYYYLMKEKYRKLFVRYKCKVIIKDSLKGLVSIFGGDV